MAAFKLDVIEQYFDNDGLLLSTGVVYVYSAGTSTPTATYTDATGLIAAENPIELDSSGRCQTWFLPGSYKCVLKTAVDPDGVTLETVDGIVVADPNAGVVTGKYLVDYLFHNTTPPTSSEWLGGHSFGVAVTFPANFGGAGGKIRTNPTASFVITLRKNSTTASDGTAVGTVTVATNGVFAFASTAGATISMAALDELSAWGPASADGTANDFNFTLMADLDA